MQSINQEPTPYEDVNRVLLDLLRRVTDILGENFIGMYLYGSLAAGDFEPARSDIDFVVITGDHLADPIIKLLEAMHLELAQEDDKWVKKLEGAYVPKEVIRRHDPGHPPVQTINEGKFYSAPLGGDWIIQRNTLRESKCIISGPPAEDLIDPVSNKEIRDAILEGIDAWWEPMIANPSRLSNTGYQPYAVLSMCRMLHTVETGELASKSRAANWALAVLPAAWSSLIRHALAWGDGDEIESIDRTIEFMRYAIGVCRKSESQALNFSLE